MMKKQKVGAIVLAGVMMLGMTGCGNSKAKAYSKYVTLGDYKGIEYTETVADVTEMMNDGINYDESGFQTMIPSKYVEGKEYKIAIAFYVDQERYILKTDQEFVVEDEED